GQAFGAAERAKRDPDVVPERFGRFEHARTPDRAYGLACEGDVAEFLQRREPRGRRILAAVDALLDADGEMAADFFVEIVIVRDAKGHAYSSLARGFMTRPIASTSCDQRSRSRESCALPAAVNW